ncbi:MAG: hypothetical protein AAGH70_12635 [Pseudomonadota bacterium]
MSIMMTPEGESYLATSPVQEKAFQRRTAFVVGLSTLILPIAVIYYDFQSGPSCARNSISHYFYEPLAGQFFVVLLAFIGGFFLRYKGERPIDGRLAKAGCIAALCVAFFPTGGIGCAEDGAFDVTIGVLFEGLSNVSQIGDFTYALAPVLDAAGEPSPPFTLTAEFSNSISNIIHKLAAFSLFLVMAWFTAVAFRRVNADVDRGADGDVTPIKRARNAVYLACAVGMAGAALLIILSFFGVNLVARPVFVGEAVFLILGGISWLVKGRFLLWSIDLQNSARR